MTDTAEATAPAPAFDYAEMTRILFKEIREEGHPVSGYFEGRKLLILTTTGAKSGEPRESALAYSIDGDRLVIVASKNGGPTNPSWYHNLVANPIVTIEVDKERFQARATATEGAERQRLWDGHVAVNPAFADYLTKTDRVIPVISLERLPA